jgi:CO dehydrogenase nickel-insertion accessory protein CooC1
MPGLALSLGVDAGDTAMLTDAAERDERGRWRLRRGTGPVRAIRRYAMEGPDGVLLLQCGKVAGDGLPPLMPSINAFYGFVHRLGEPKSLRDWSIVGDLPAGPRQLAFDWAPYADTAVVVVEPTSKSALTARRIARIARSRAGVRVVPVANKVEARGDVARIERLLGEDVTLAVPADDAVAEAERLGVPLLDHAPDAAAVKAVAELADRLTLGR